MSERRVLHAVYERRRGWGNAIATDAGAGGLDARCAAVARTVTFDATVLPVEQIAFTGTEEGVLLGVALKVPDRRVPDRVEWISVWRERSTPWRVLEQTGPEYLNDWLRETIVNLLAHEVAESLFVDGARIFDPHTSRPLDRVYTRT